MQFEWWARSGIVYGILGRFVKFKKSDFWVCSVCPHGTAWLPLDGFSMKYDVCVDFLKICQENSSFIKT